MKKTFLFILTAMVISLFAGCKQGSDNEPEEQSNYVDLGLPSGTLWKNANETNNQSEYNLFSFDEAIEKFGQQLPTKEQWQELIDECTWSWTYAGWKIIGSNKNYIILPPDGRLDCEGTYQNKIGDGDYWSAASDGADGAYKCSFDAGTKGSIDWTFRCCSLSVRLVQDVK